jgi:phosphoribosylamine--glycine ligase
MKRGRDMRVLVIGGGGREHAIVWKLAGSPGVSKIYCAPGNAGIGEIAQCVNIDSGDIDALLSFAVREKIGLTVVGPELPLVLGIADKFNEKGLKVFGPCRKGAMLEGSKRYAKEFMGKYQIPTAGYAVYDNAVNAIKGLGRFTFPIVIKANGLAAGKGVIICKDTSDAKKAIEDILINKEFGDAGNEIIMEEYLEGREASLMCLVNNNTIIPLESAMDYKKASDDDTGPNTGGMGCVSPNEVLDKKLMGEIRTGILDRIFAGLHQERICYNGILYVGLMITLKGAKVLEFNVRFGDPETQAVLPRLKSDLLNIFLKTIDNTVSQEDLKWSDKVCMCTVLTSGGYPVAYEKGKAIRGLDLLDKDILSFHAGTKKTDKIVTNGGRVLTVGALADNFSEGREKVYKNIDKIYFDNMAYRKDIGNF